MLKKPQKQVGRTFASPAILPKWFEGLRVQRFEIKCLR